jgi:hypothetical protein
MLTKITPTSNFMQISPVGVELFHADGRTDMTKLIVTFRSFAKANKIERVLRRIVAVFRCNILTLISFIC